MSDIKSLILKYLLTIRSKILLEETVEYLAFNGMYFILIVQETNSWDFFKREMCFYKKYIMVILKNWHTFGTML